EFMLSKFPNPKFCERIPKRDLVRGDTRLLKTIETGKDGGLRGAVVAVTDIEDQGFMERFRGTEVIAEFCEFMPFTGVVVPNQSSFRVVNYDSDPDDPKSVKGVLHNPHSFEVMGASSATIFNIGLTEKGKGLDKPLRLRKAGQGSVLKMQCDQHEFMQSWFLPVTNPYYAVVRDDGSFEIQNVPSGRQ